MAEMNERDTDTDTEEKGVYNITHMDSNNREIDNKIIRFLVDNAGQEHSIENIAEGTGISADIVGERLQYLYSNNSSSYNVHHILSYVLFL
jgi:predicted AAA+ superfamily ATPase